MKMNVTFQESKQSFSPGFGEVHNISDGGYDRGYAAGYETGNVEGYTKGHIDGASDGAESLVLKTIERFSSDKVVTVKQSVFQDCTELEELSLPNIESIPNSMCQNCVKLKKIIFPRLTGAVGISSFQTCTSLEYADIGEAASLGAAAFHGCRPLSTLIVRKNDIVSLGSTNTLGSTLIASGTGFIYVPDNLVEQYKAATNWSTYASQIKPISELEGET